MPALTPNEQGVAGVITTICPQQNERGLSQNLRNDCNALISGAVTGSPTANAIAQITIDQARQPMNASQTSVRAQSINIGARLAALRGSATSLPVRGLTFDSSSKTLWADPLVNGYLKEAEQQKAGGAASADDTFGRLGGFIDGTYINGDRNATINEAGYDFDTWGLTAGADYRLTDSLILGGAFNYVNASSSLQDKGGDLDTNGYGLTLYGTYYQTEQFYLDGILGYGWNSYDQSRSIIYTLPTVPGLPSSHVNQTLSADYDGTQFTFGLGGGYELSRGAWTVTPTAGLQYVRADVDGYGERAANSGPGSGWTVQVTDQSYKSFTMRLGGQVSYALSQSWGVLLPQAGFSWVHEFNYDNPSVTGWFLGDPTQTAFLLATDLPDRNYFDVGIGASAVFAKGRSAYLYYQAVLGYQDLTSNSINLGVRLEF